MPETLWKLGSDLAPEVQREALARFVHRFTHDHRPNWAREPMPDGRPYPVQFSSDADWLAHTRFAVTKAGKLSGATRYCSSTPTWPDGAPPDKPGHLQTLANMRREP